MRFPNVTNEQRVIALRKEGERERFNAFMQKLNEFRENLSSEQIKQLEIPEELEADITAILETLSHVELHAMIRAGRELGNEIHGVTMLLLGQHLKVVLEEGEIDGY